jgi:hypothetical protein
VIHLKPGVIVEGLHKELYFAAGIVECEFAGFGIEAEITSALDGTHNHVTLHQQGLAIDIGWKDVLSAISSELYGRIKMRLERRGFDVVDERSRPQDSLRMWTAPHVHIEFQPKEGERFWA